MKPNELESDSVLIAHERPWNHITYIEKMYVKLFGSLKIEYNLIK